jgi:hypothetical protein
MLRDCEIRLLLSEKAAQVWGLLLHSLQRTSVVVL